MNVFRVPATDRARLDARFSRASRAAGLSVVLLLFLPGCVSHWPSMSASPSARPASESAPMKTAASSAVESGVNKSNSPAAVASAATTSNGSSDSGWQSLFDGKTMNGWKITGFGGHGEVGVEDDQLMLHAGAMLTGVSWTNELPKTDYEVQLEARKIDGGDFFCGLTFPVGDTFCSLIAGGWGGGVVGLSSIDGMDASENETTKTMSFPKGRWFRIKLRVTPAKIQAWIDDEQMVDQSIVGRKISLRAGDIYLSEPFGIATWQTTGALRNIRLRRLADAPTSPVQ